MKVEIISHTQDFFGTIAKAASVCYDSEPSLKIVKQCINSGHCYDEKTEVLTDNGFMFWKDVDYQTKIATVNPIDRTFNNFETPLALIQYPYNGQMYCFNSKTIDLCITPEHKLYCSLNSQKNRSSPKFELMSANTIIKTNNRFKNKPVYKKPLRMVTASINNNLSTGNPIYKLYGFFIGDGHLENINTGRISFHLKKERKIKYLQEICKECNLELEEKANNCYKLKKLGMEKFYNINKEKTFPLNFLKMSREDFEYFYEGLINSDGSVSATSIQYHTTSKELVDRLQALFSINDITHTINKKVFNNSNWKDIYVINISKSVLKYPMFNDSRSKKMSIEINYNGMVYCAETSTGLIIIRRNGKICLCGNCSVLEHSSFTFKIEGCSRATSHQLVRHRIASYSQRSQRYCIEDNIEYIIPSSNETQIFTDAYDKINQSYKELIEANVPAEDARMVLPNGCPTTIFVTMNLRSLAHFMNERLCFRSQWEIRKVATLIRNKILVSEDFSDEEKEIFRMLLVPKCEINQDLHFCTEKKSCGRNKTIKEIKEILVDNSKTNKETNNKTNISNKNQLQEFVSLDTFEKLKDLGVVTTFNGIPIIVLSQTDKKQQENIHKNFNNDDDDDDYLNISD